jgi:hypothetical protein
MFETEKRKPPLMNPSVFKKRKGQGVVEYAGALVIGAVIVSAALAVGPTMVTNIFSQIQTAVSTMFTTGTGSIN